MCGKTKRTEMTVEQQAIERASSLPPVEFKPETTFTADNVIGAVFAIVADAAIQRVYGKGYVTDRDRTLVNSIRKAANKVLLERSATFTAYVSAEGAVTHVLVASASNPERIYAPGGHPGDEETVPCQCAASDYNKPCWHFALRLLLEDYVKVVKSFEGVEKTFAALGISATIGGLMA